MRFFLITYIICGHFIRFVNPSEFVAKFFAQINVVVGAFFALSGYVTAYTTTENKKREANAKLIDTPSSHWILSRVFGYYPLHLATLLLFSPVFLYPDVHFSGWPTAIGHGIISATMTQAWFPMHAEIWNAPTWFLSSLTFANIVLRYALPIVAKMSKVELRRAALALFVTGVLPKIGYCYDTSGWGLTEGTLSPKQFPGLALYNVQRFNPFFATVEVLLGAVACRLVMLDNAEGEKRAPTTNQMSTILPVLGMTAMILLRSNGMLQLSDMLSRALIFIPLFLKFLMAAHRASVEPTVKNILVKMLSSKALVGLGSISFPMFVLHGPIGQICYKKVVATKLFGSTLNVKFGPQFFYVYLTIVLTSAWIAQKTFVGSKKVQNWSKATVSTIASKLRDDSWLVWLD